MALDRGIIDQQLKALGESASWWDHRELRDLPSVLNADEEILAISRGKAARPRWLHRSWLIVITDARLICLRSARGSGWRQLELSAHQAERVALRVGLFRGRVLIATPGRTYRLLVPRADVYKLLAAVSSWGIPGKEPLSGFGPTRMARRLFDHVLALPTVALSPDAASGARQRVIPPPPNPRVEVLEDEVQQLRQQVDFLEQLLRERHQSQSAHDSA